LNTIPRESAWNPGKAKTSILLLFALLNLAVFAVRAVSVGRFGSLFATSGGEVLMIYSVWKRMHHLPVYEFPLKYPFCLSLYNYLFYETYAAILKLLGASGAGIKVVGRFVTSMFPVIGAIAQWRLVQFQLNLRGIRSFLSLILALGLWFCTSMIRWWALTFRPDMAAIALVMVALFLVVRRPRFGFFAAGLVFYLAWSFKQSVALTFAATCIYLLFQRRWRDVVPMATVFAVLAATTLLIGSPEYRFNVLVAPRLVIGFSLSHAFRTGGVSLISNAYWVIPPIFLGLTARRQRLDGTRSLLLTTFSAALILGLAAMTRSGGSDNYLLEAFVSGSTLMQIAFFGNSTVLAPALLLYGCLQPAAQLALLSASRHSLGFVQVATRAEFDSIRTVLEQISRLRRPIVSTDETLAAPWISTRDQYPAFAIDFDFYTPTHLRCENGGVEGLIRRGEIPTVIVGTKDTLFRENLNPGYVHVGEYDHQGFHFDIYTLDAAANR